MTSAQLTTSDGLVLEADVADPPGTTARQAGVVVCHPHPRYGGNRFNNVVEALYSALPAAGFRTVRFDFRAAAGDGIAERLDVIAALDELSARDTARCAVVGYSFGASVALTTTDDRIAALVAIAPPLSMMPADAPIVPTLVLTPRYDQFCPPDAAEAIVAGWGRAAFEVVESADHFLLGATTPVATRVTEWLLTNLGS